MMGVSGHHELPPAQAEQIVLAHQAVDAFVIDRPTATLEFRRHPRPAVTGKFQRDALQRVTKFQVWIWPGGARDKAIKPCPAHLR